MISNKLPTVSNEDILCASALHSALTNTSIWIKLFAVHLQRIQLKHAMLRPNPVTICCLNPHTYVYWEYAFNLEPVYSANGTERGLNVCLCV